MKSIENRKAFLEQIIQLIEQESNQEIRDLICELHHADIAEILDDLNFDRAKYVFTLLDEEIAANILTDLEEDVREKLLSELSSEEIARSFIDNLNTDDAADVINELEEEQKGEVLSHIEDKEHASDIADLLSYDEDTAGGIMEKEIIMARLEWSVQQCLKEIRQQAIDVEKIYTIYVVDEFNELKGILSLRILLLSADNTLVADIFNPKVISAKAKNKAEDIAQIMEKYELVALPIVDELNRLIGRVTIDDAVEVLREEAEKDYQMAAGLADDIESDDSIKDITKARLPWLLIGLIGGLLGAEVMEYFGIEKHIELAFFAPLIAAMGGNVGVQSAAIIVQGLAGNNLGRQTTAQRMFKETIIALINGVVLAILAYFASYFIIGDWQFSKVLALALVAVIIFAALFGTLVPLTLNKFKIDPALATGPFITTANDIFGLCIYFLLAKMMLGGV